MPPRAPPCHCIGTAGSLLWREGKEISVGVFWFGFRMPLIQTLWSFLLWWLLCSHRQDVQIPQLAPKPMLPSPAGCPQLLPIGYPCSTHAFTSPLTVSPGLHHAWVGSLNCMKSHQGAELMARAEQEAYFPFPGKITEFNLNAFFFFFALKCPRETIKSCLHILSRFWHLKAIGI